MQIGTRWPVGGQAPVTLDPGIADAITGVEDQLKHQEEDVAGWFWTLTYLEGKQRAELTDGTVVAPGADGIVTVTMPGYEDEHEDW